MDLITNEMMREIEAQAINDVKIPSIILMENAASTVTEVVLKESVKRVLVFAGKGNNGGDGLACARQLMAKGAEVKIIFVGSEESATEDCKRNLDILKNIGADICCYNSGDDISAYLSEADVIIDALIGIGLKRALSELYIELVEKINSAGKRVVAVDCPTGVCTDKGQALPIAVRASTTVTFHQPKIGLFLFPAAECVGEIVVGSIGYPDLRQSSYKLLTDKEALRLLPERYKHSHKGSYGRVTIFAGCDEMAGAAVICAKAAYSSGCGLVNVKTTRHCAEVIQGAVSEATTTIMDSKDGYISLPVKGELSETVIVGCGLGITDETRALVKELVLNTEGRLIIDADALNILSEDASVLEKARGEVVITPHLKEMSRLTGKSVKEISENPVGTAVDFAREYKVSVALKDAHSVIANPDGRVYINTEGTNAMSKGGSGDCLTGVIGGFCAQGLSGFESAALGAFICGRAGKISAEEKGEYSPVASDTIAKLADAIKSI